MRFDAAIDAYIRDQQHDGRINGEHSERAYRSCLILHAQDVGNRDPSLTGKRDVMRTLERWANPTTRTQKYAILKSFYRWTVFEEIRTTNPVEQVRPPRRKEPVQQRLTLDEVHRVVAVADPVRRDRWAVRLMLLAGIRNQELRSLQGRHLARDGWIWIDKDAGKGGKERYVPVVAELEDVVAEIRMLVGLDEYVLPGRRRVNPPLGDEMAEYPRAMLSARSLGRLVELVGVRAGLPFKLTPHAFRHTFASRAVRTAGDRATQSVLGHSSIQTTIDTYSSRVTLDELQVSFTGFGFGLPRLSLSNNPQEASSDEHAR